MSQSVRHNVRKDGRPSFSYGKLKSLLAVSVAGAGLAAVVLSPAPAARSQAAAPRDLLSIPAAPSVHRFVASGPHQGFVAASLSLNASGGLAWFNHFGKPAKAQLPAEKDRFAAVVEQAKLSPAKLASLFAGAKPSDEKTARPVVVASLEPVAERFASLSDINEAASNSIILAYADPSEAETSGAVAAMNALAPSETGSLAARDLEDRLDIEAEAALEPGGLPDEGPLPLGRPGIARNAEEPAKAVEEAPPSDEKPARIDQQRAERTKPAAEQRQAFAKPDRSGGEKAGAGIGRSFKGLFGGGKRAGNGVAVYDISAAKVYMPDGSVLEAHSGIGKMADNPRYANVKMTGPTPPHTYNLKMRESRFHGVEAIRMLPVDGRNKHGRDGFLTHSYLLRGGRAESHGCVAFKDYNKFLNAFKRGKIRQLVVVPGGGRSAVQVADNDVKSSNAGSSRATLR